MDVLATFAKTVALVSKVSDNISNIVSNRELEERFARMPAKLGSMGVDPFGFDPEYAKRFIGLIAWLYRKYFRCDAYGIEHIPEGPCLIVCNHSGQLPFDGAMVTAAIFLDREPPRFLRSMVEYFVPSTPFVSTFLARCGQILGTPDNCRRLLDSGDAILVFPEGVRGLNKTWEKRYQLQRFGQGFLRLALEKKIPIVPAVVIGAEEQAPTLYNASFIGKFFGFPALPVTPLHPWLPGIGLLPLPTKYRIYFHEPINVTGDANDEADVIQKKVDEIKSTMQHMLDKGLRERQNVFW